MPRSKQKFFLFLPSALSLLITSLSIGVFTSPKRVEAASLDEKAPTIVFDFSSKDNCKSYGLDTTSSEVNGFKATSLAYNLGWKDAYYSSTSIEGTTQYYLALPSGASFYNDENLHLREYYLSQITISFLNEPTSSSFAFYFESEKVSPVEVSLPTIENKKYSYTNLDSACSYFEIQNLGDDELWIRQIEICYSSLDQFEGSTYAKIPLTTSEGAVVNDDGNLTSTSLDYRVSMIKEKGGNKTSSLKNATLYRNQILNLSINDGYLNDYLILGVRIVFSSTYSGDNFRVNCVYQDESNSGVVDLGSKMNTQIASTSSDGGVHEWFAKDSAGVSFSKLLIQNGGSSQYSHDQLKMTALYVWSAKKLTSHVSFGNHFFRLEANLLNSLLPQIGDFGFLFQYPDESEIIQQVELSNEGNLVSDLYDQLNDGFPYKRSGRHSFFYCYSEITSSTSQVFGYKAYIEIDGVRYLPWSNYRQIVYQNGEGSVLE